MWCWRKRQSNPQPTYGRSELSYFSGVLVGLILLFIAIEDFRSHRISNRSLLVLIFCIVVSQECYWNPCYSIASLFVAIIAYRFLGLGGGDVKLIVVITLLLTPHGEIVNYWLYASIFSLVLIALHLLIFRTIKGAIALAPALCGAVLCIS